jgi:hypothetical protein
MLTEPWPCASSDCDELIFPTGKRGRPATYCPACRAKPRRRPAPAVPDVPTRYGAPTSVESVQCGCGRDYLTVPLEDAHRCPYPLGRKGDGDESGTEAAGGH